MFACDHANKSSGAEAALFPAKFTRLTTFTGTAEIFSNPLVEDVSVFLFNQLRVLPPSIKTLNLRVYFTQKYWDDIEWEHLKTDTRQLVALERVELQIILDRFDAPEDVQKLVNQRIEALELFKHGVLQILPWTREVSIYPVHPCIPFKLKWITARLNSTMTSGICALLIKVFCCCGSR